MKILFLILISLSQSVYASTEVPAYVISSDCVLSVEVNDSISNTGWTVIVNINESAAESLLIFSKKHLKKQVRFIDGEGNKISNRDVMLQTPVSKSIHLTGLKSRREANAAKNSILSTKVACGAR